MVSTAAKKQPEVTCEMELGCVPRKLFTNMGGELH